MKYCILVETLKQNDGEIKDGGIKDSELKDGEIKDGEIKDDGIKDGDIKDGSAFFIPSVFYFGWRVLKCTARYYY